MTVYGSAHLLTLLAIGLIGATLIFSQRRGANWPLVLLAWLNFSTYPVNQLAYATLDFPISPENIFPFQLCDVAALICGFALLTKKRTLCELAFLWGLTGTIQGLLTPNMPYGPESPVYWGFFLQHGVIVITALFIPLALNWRPDRWTFWRVQLWSQVYFFSALAINAFFGTNYGFLREKPRGASVLDYFGDWPYYLIGIQLFAIFAYLLLLLPFAPHLRKKK